MLALKFLHILTMFATVTLFVGGEVILTAVARTRDVGALRRVAAITKRTDGLGILLLLVGVALGILTAVTGQFDLTAPWLIIAYVLVGILIATGIFYFAPQTKRLAEALEASGDRFSPELAQLLDPRREMVVLVLDVALWSALIYVMVVKPFS
jgi:uncharacterized membrane protein SirB2